MRSISSQSVWIRFFLMAVLLAVSYFLGAVTVHRNYLPYRYLVDLKEQVSADKPLVSNVYWPERREQFEMFGREADVVMIGDSITHAGHWEDIFPDVKVANRGVGSDRTDDVLRRIGTILSVKPKKAFIMIGTNDVYSGVNLSETYDNYKKIIDILRANSVEVFVQSTLECSKKLCGDKVEKIRHLNIELKKLAELSGVHYVDVNSGITGEIEGLLDEYTYDGVHLLGAGYRRWADKISNFL